MGPGWPKTRKKEKVLASQDLMDGCPNMEALAEALRHQGWPCRGKERKNIGWESSVHEAVTSADPLASG